MTVKITYVHTFTPSFQTLEEIRHHAKMKRKELH